METLSIPINELLEKAPNHTISELSEIYGTDTGTIYRILSRYKVTPASGYNQITKEVLNAVFEEPQTLKEAASSLNVTIPTVSSALKKYKMINGRKPTVKTTFNGFRIFKILGHIINHPEESLASVGRKFNCTREYVRQIKECAINEGIIKQEVINE